MSCDQRDEKLARAWRMEIGLHARHPSPGLTLKGEEKNVLRSESRNGSENMDDGDRLACMPSFARSPT